LIRLKLHGELDCAGAGLWCMVRPSTTPPGRREAVRDGDARQRDPSNPCAKENGGLDILVTRELTRSFGALRAVDALDLAVREGEVFGLLGRNGAGKTTLIKMLTTLLPPTAGSATVDGFDVAREPARVRAIIGYVPQALSADGELTGRENLLVFTRLYDIPGGLRRQRIDEGLAFMGLADAADKLVATYSGGMIRRLEIAQSMLHRPRVLFLDEPTVGLDPVAREIVWAHIEELRSHYGTTIVLTSHYMDEVEKLCDRVAILRRGKLVALGTLPELRANAGEAAGSLDEVFAFYTEDAIETTGGYRDTAKTRRNVRRLG
jgi:ABC-2 type transport system ATP-binding protein